MNMRSPTYSLDGPTSSYSRPETRGDQFIFACLFSSLSVEVISKFCPNEFIKS